MLVLRLMLLMRIIFIFFNIFQNSTEAANVNAMAATFVSGGVLSAQISKVEFESANVVFDYLLPITQNTTGSTGSSGTTGTTGTTGSTGTTGTSGKSSTTSEGCTKIVLLLGILVAMLVM